MGCTHSRDTAAVAAPAGGVPNKQAGRPAAVVTDADISAAYNPYSLPPRPMHQTGETAIAGSLYPVLTVPANRPAVTTVTSAAQTSNSVPSSSRVCTDPQVEMFRNNAIYINGLELPMYLMPFGSYTYMILRYIQVKARPFFMFAIDNGHRMEYSISGGNNGIFTIHTSDPQARIDASCPNYGDFNELGITRSDLFENMTIKAYDMPYVFDEDTIAIFEYYFLKASPGTQLRLVGIYGKQLRFEIIKVDGGYKILTIHA